MIDKQINYIQQIYRIILTLIGIWFLNLVWPFISDVILMLVFAFLFTTLLLSSVDTFERKIGNRGLSVLGVVIILFTSISTFIGSFISQISIQAQEFSERVDQTTMMNEFKALGDKATSAMPSFMKSEESSSDYLANKLTEITQSILGSLGSLVSIIGNFMFIAIMVFIFTIILLSEYHKFKKTLVNSIPNKFFEVGLKLIYNIEKSVSSYLRGQFLSAASVAGMSIAGLLLLNFFGANITLVIFIGTIFPLIYETLYSRQITVGRAYYDILVGPLLLILLGLMIFSVKLSIKNLNIQKWLNENVILINIALIVTIFTLFLLNNSYILIITVSFSFLLIFTTVSNFYKSFRLTKGSNSYWTGQIAHLGIGIFALGIILNVSQSFSTEIELNSFQEFNFNNDTYFIYNTIEESLPEKNVLKLPISNTKQTKYTSLNIFKNSSQQAISSPAVFRSIINDIYITVKFINEDSYKLIVRNNYGVLIMWIGLLITSLSFFPRLRKNEV